MAALDTRQHVGQTSAPVELSTLASSDHAEAQPLQQNGSEAVVAQHPLLDINQAWEQMRQARSARGRDAVAAALEPYVGATNFRSGEPIPADLMAHMAPLGSRKWVICFLIAYTCLFPAACYVWPVRPCLNDTDSTCGAGGDHGHGSWLCYAIFPLSVMPMIGILVLHALHCGLCCAQSPLCLVERCRAFSALYLLYCQDMCRHGSPDEIVHKVATSSCMYTVHGDGSIQVSKPSSSLRRCWRSSRSTPPPENPAS